MLEQAIHSVDLSSNKFNSFVDRYGTNNRSNNSASLQDNDLLALKENLDGLKKVASSFEGVFTQMIFKEMKKTVHSDEGILPESNDQKFYQEMLDEEIAKELGANGALGIKDAIVRTYGQRYLVNGQSKINSLI